MDDFLDALLSHTWLITAVCTIGFLVSVGIWMVPLWRGKRLVVLRAAVSLSFLGFVLYLMFGPAGYAVDFVEVGFYGDRAVALEQHYSGDGDGGSYLEHRIYVIDMTAGKRLMRQSVEPSKLHLVTAQGAFVEDYGQGIVLHSLNDWKALKTWNKETGFEQFPELQPGINQMTYWQGSSPSQCILQLTTQKGRVYYFDLQTQKLTEQPPTRLPQPKFSDYYLDLRERKANAYYSFVRSSGEIQHLQMQQNNAPKPVVVAQDFLDPDFVVFDSTRNLFIIRHFETLERTTVLLTAFDTDLHKKWEISQATQFPAAKPQRDAKNRIVPMGDNLWVSIGGYAALVKTEDGKVLWARQF